MRASLPLLLLITSSLAACGSSAPSGTGGSAGAGTGGGASGPTLHVVYGAPASGGAEPMAEDHPVDGYVTAVAAHGSLVAVGTSTSVLVVGPDGATPLEIVGDGSVPAETGVVRSMVAHDAGVLVAAENGVFFTDGSVLQPSLGADALVPLGITAMTPRAVSVEGGATETYLSIVGAEAAYEIGGGQTVKWTVEGESSAPSAFFAQEARAFVTFGHHAYEIDKAAKKAYPLGFDIGAVRAIACSSLACDEGSLLYFATDGGLVERGADGVYRRYPLSAEGEAAVPVESFALDPTKQRLYAIAGTQLLRVRAGEVPEAVATLAAPAMARRAAVDKSGDVWFGEGQLSRRLVLGTPLSFATDVRPILHEYCADCHATGKLGAPVVDFESYDVASARIDEILMRIQNQSMPPPSYGKKVPKETIQLLADWAVDKAP